MFFHRLWYHVYYHKCKNLPVVKKYLIQNYFKQSIINKLVKESKLGQDIKFYDYLKD